MNTRIVFVLDGLKILNLSSSLANYAMRRHSVIAENIANADTPAFKARDLPDFHEIYTGSSSSDMALRIQNLSPIESSSSMAASPDGNTVSIEEQMLKSAETKNEHALALMIYRKSLDLIKMSVSKNL